MGREGTDLKPGVGGVEKTTFKKISKASTKKKAGGGGCVRGTVRLVGLTPRGIIYYKVEQKSAGLPVGWSQERPELK